MSGQPQALVTAKDSISEDEFKSIPKCESYRQRPGTCDPTSPISPCLYCSTEPHSRIPLRGGKCPSAKSFFREHVGNYRWAEAVGQKYSNGRTLCYTQKVDPAILSLPPDTDPNSSAAKKNQLKDSATKSAKSIYNFATGKSDNPAQTAQDPFAQNPQGFGQNAQGFGGASAGGLDTGVMGMNDFRGGPKSPEERLEGARGENAASTSYKTAIFAAGGVLSLCAAGGVLYTVLRKKERSPSEEDERLLHSVY